MEWSRNLRGRWMEVCYLCKMGVHEEICSPRERRYSCINPECGTLFHLYLLHPARKKRGAFACAVIAQRELLREAMRTFLYREFVARCPVCDAKFIEKVDAALYHCASAECGVSVEFFLEKMLFSFVALTVIMRVPEPGFSFVLSGRHDHRHDN